MSVIEKLSMLYFEKTGTSPKMSLFSWLDAMTIEPSDEAFQYILNHPEEFEFPTITPPQKFIGTMGMSGNGMKNLLPKNQKKTNDLRQKA